MAVMPELLTHSTIERVAFDYGVEFLTGDGAIIRIEGLGTVGYEGEPWGVFDAEGPADEVSTLVEFLHAQTEVVLDGACLELVSKASQLTLRVEPSADYEAWSVSFPDGSRLICTTEGAVARWSAS